MEYEPPRIKAIPTDYRGVAFRSRLEAKWAAFFDLVGWNWQYEPIDLNGYIPDFVLTLYKPVLVEVKPEFYINDLWRHTHKIEDSGWEHEAMIVGTDILDSADGFNFSCLGIHGERGITEEKHPLADNGWFWAESVFHRCLNCKKISFHNSTMTFNCRVNGCYDGDHYLNYITLDEARRMFATASSIVQYNR